MAIRPRNRSEALFVVTVFLVWADRLTTHKSVAVAVPIRDAFLRQDPMLLSELLRKSNVSHGEGVEASNQEKRGTHR